VSTEIAGLAVAAEPPGLMTPLTAVAVVRGLDDAGKVRTWLLYTEGVDVILAVGMHESAAEMWKAKLR